MRVDTTTFLGILVGVGCIFVGQWIEGGNVGSVLQVAAALIVLGGTAGAVITQFPARELGRAMHCLRRAVLEPPDDSAQSAEHLVAMARHARRDGLVKLEEDIARSTDPFLHSAVEALLEGHSSAQLRILLEAELIREQEEDEAGPRVLEAAGGYAPTIGILGAVLGLIQVMENLSEPDRLGGGIAIAFVATIYGVASANLIFLPLAQKVRTKLLRDVRRKEIILEGICAIQEGMNPALLARRLQALIGHA
jgi:chemotaxis protein MotA